MKVSELIQQLQQFDQDSEVYVNSAFTFGLLNVNPCVDLPVDRAVLGNAKLNGPKPHSNGEFVSDYLRCVIIQFNKKA